MRTINLNVPASIIFDPQRGLHYLAHELFHYAAPYSRKKRNYYMGCFIICECFKTKFLRIFNQMLYTTSNGTENNGLKKLLQHSIDDFGLSPITRYIFFTYYSDDNELNGKFWLDERILTFIQRHYCEWSQHTETNVVAIKFQDKILEFCNNEESSNLFKNLCKDLMHHLSETFMIHFNEKCKQNTIAMIDSMSNGNIFMQPEELQMLIDRFYYYIACEENQKSLLNSSWNNPIPKHCIDVIGTLWNQVKEACCDIAMVSVTSMSLADYLLFCIQSWQDSTCGNLGISNINEDQWVRVGLVYAYFKSDYWDTKSEITTKEFIVKFVLTFISRKDLEPMNQDSFKNLILIAQSWWVKFEYKCDKKFFMTYANKDSFSFIAFFEPIFKYILSDFDINQVRNKMDSENKIVLERNIREFKKNVYAKYNALVSDAFSLDSQILNTYRDEYFKCNLDMIQHFQNQKTFAELANINAKQPLDTSNWEPEPPSEDPAELNINSMWEFHIRSVEELLFYLQFYEENYKKVMKRN